MSSQFKHPLGGKSQSAIQKNEWLTGGAQPAVPGVQSQGSFSLTGQVAPQAGADLSVPPWQPGAQSQQARETPSPVSLAELSTIKQPSINRPSFPGPNALPQTPSSFVQGQHGRYGPGGPQTFSGPKPGPQGIPQGPGSSQMFAPPQQGPARSGPLGSSLAVNPASASASFSMPGRAMVAAPAPGMFNPPRPGMGPGADASLVPVRGGNEGSPGKGSGGKRKKKGKVPIWARIVIGFLSTLLVLGGTGFWYYEANFAGAVNNIVGQNVQRAKDEGDPNANLTNGILTGPRVNILLLGSDTDQKFQGNYIAQTDIVVTIDPNSKTVGMLSIPRDFYINVPGYGLHKLDEAYGLGGVDLSRRTIEQDFGIPINYYAWVGLDGFIKVINTVSGVDVDVQHPIVDDNYPDDVGANANDPYALKRLYLAPGPQHLDGPTALEYVRSRHADLVGDFGRSVRQQQVLGALKSKLVNPDIFGKLSDIAKDLNGYVKTDMQLPDVLKLMNFARSLDPNKIAKLTLGPPYSSTGKSPSGADVVIPNCDRIIPAISQMLQLGNRAVCNIGYDSNNPSVATSTGAPTPLSSPGPVPGADFQNLGNMASNATAALGSGPSDLFGIHSLLDLLFLGVFESPDAFQV
ncbi:MAG TPA: LCP family protein [Ktedonobacteraceae bacterium]|nr:LCP family protein [Ktedonobacteraceae bacterium]